MRDHTFDGKKLANYFCSAELKGAPKFSRMCSIGITCHEFGHSLGLPDFYDIDYEENGLNKGLYIFSTMCDGAYNDDSRTPPYFNAEERIMLGWMDESDVKPVAAGDNVLEFIDANVAMRSEATAEGEYFLYEKRGGSGNKWDSFLPEGLVVYHVDKSPSHMIGGRYTAEGIWRTNSINRFGGHPCFTVVPPMAPESTDYANEKVDYSDLVLPGFHEIVSFSPPADWDGNESELSLTNIRLDGKPTVGIPMALNMFELLPFWHTLLTHLGFNVIVSDDSTRKTFINGQHTIPSDTICYPAKLLHGHMEQLLKLSPDVIFYPCMSYNVDEGNGDNHYNCPVVAYYPEVANVNIKALHDVKFIHDFVGIHNQKAFPAKFGEVMKKYGFSFSKKESVSHR